MNNFLLSAVCFALIFQGCAQSENQETKKEAKAETTDTIVKVDQQKASVEFKITDFLSDNEQLDQDVERIFSTLDDTAIVAQLIMPAIGRLGQTEATIKSLINKRQIGGILMLNGTKEQFTNWINEFEGMNDSLGALPFLYSADAEPSLVNRKITGSTPVKKANELTSIDEVREVADIISKDLNEIGINYNFSPVVDMSPNKTVGFRSFGSVPANIIPWSDAFIQQTQQHNIIATAKHFPGHGLVSGDTHKALQMIDGELKEI